MTYQETNKMDGTTWTWFKGVLAYATVAIMGWLFTLHLKEKDKVSGLQARIEKLEITTEITKVMLKHLSEDIAEVKEGVKQLVDSQVRRRK